MIININWNYQNTTDQGRKWRWGATWWFCPLLPCTAIASAQWLFTI